MRVGTRGRALRALVVVCAFASAVQAQGAHAATPPPPSVEEIARTNKISVAKTRMILADKTARVHSTGHIYFVEPRPSPTAQTTPVPAAAASFPYAQTFRLHSRPGSSRVIYLDFDGETISDTFWNDHPSYGTPSSFYAEPFSLDATPDAFSTDEQDVVQSVWQRVAEDYAPFDVDVTTQDPGTAAIDRTGASDTTFGTRALVTDMPEISSTCRCGGVAFTGAFDDATRHAKLQPALIFPKGGLWDDPKNIAEAASHEIGHNFALAHDGNRTTGFGYYGGHGAWAPIMGVGYNVPITQWSRGEYSVADNAEDDLAIIAARGAPRLADDVGDTTATAASLAGPSFRANGMITADADVDMFRIDAAAGPSTFTVTPAPNSPNLDLRLRLLSSDGTAIATDDPQSSTSTRDVAAGLSATIARSLPSAGTYYLAVDGVGALDPATTGYSGYGSIGGYSLTGQDSRANDSFATPWALNGTSGRVAGTTAGATKEAGEPDHAGVPGGTSRWYRWTAARSGTFRVDTFGSSIDTVLAVYTGTAVNALRAIASNDDSGGPQSRVSFAATAGTVYHIAVDSRNGSGGPIVVNWLFGVENDNFAAATALIGPSGTVTASNVGATKEQGEPNHAFGAGGASVWHRITAPVAGTMTVDTFGSSFDTLLAVYTGTAVNALTAVAQNNNFNGSQSLVSLPATAGTVYYIAVDGWNAAEGAITLTWRIAPPNDRFSAPTPLSGSTGTTTGSNLGATSDGSFEAAVFPPGKAGGRSVWYRWTPPANGVLTVDTLGSEFNTLLGVISLSGTTFRTLATNDDFPPGTQSRVTLSVTTGTDYRFGVDGLGGATGAITLRWTLVPTVVAPARASPSSVSSSFGFGPG